jgi:uncharacterized protein GlcG (DUF336 family)/6-phosphogluconolactonase (cycloisomerase 2 family)
MMEKMNATLVLKSLLLFLLLHTGTTYAQVSYDVSHEEALQAVLAAKKKAEKLEVLVNIAVVDAGANLKSFIRMDESFLGSIDVAIKKAKTSRYFDIATGDLGKLTQPGGIIYNIEHSNDGLMTFPGGVPIQNAAGKVIGAIGVSGGTIEQDHEIALAGAKAISGTMESPQKMVATSTDNLMLYLQDFKGISANNTVTITSYKKGGADYVYVGGFKGVDVFSLDEDGELTLVSTQALYKEEGPARGMVADQIKGTDFLFVANKHGDAIETFKILDNGSLDRVSLTMDTDETHLGTAITLQVIHMEQAAYLFIGGLEDTPGLSSFKIEDDGKLSHVQSMKDDEKIFTDGIIGMFIHKIEGNTYLYTSGFQDNGVSSFKVNDNGTFKNINNIGDNTKDRYLTGAYPVTGVQLGDNHYVIVGHRHHKYYKRGGFIKNPDFFYHGDGVSVFKVNKKGGLVPHFVLKDDENTKLQGQTRIEIVSVTEQEAVLAVGTRDDASIQLCKLDINGKLSPIHYLETGFSIYYGLRSHKIGNNHFLIAGSNRFDLKKVATYKISPKIDRSGQVLRHIVNLKYKEEATPAQVEEAVQVFLGLKDEIPEIEHIEWGVNDSKEGASKGLTHCFTLTFRDDHGREVYLFHEAHIALVNKIGPIIADVLVMDYWTAE